MLSKSTEYAIRSLAYIQLQNWKGHRPGVYDSWNECQRQTAGYAGALFKSFSTRKEAEQALRDPASVKSKPSSKKTMYYVVWHGHKPGIYTS